MKTKKATASSKADQLGRLYEEAHEAQRQTASALVEAAAAIKAFAEEHGAAEGAYKLVRGLEFTVGSQTVNSSSTINWVQFQKQQPALYAKLCSLQVDEEKVERAMKNGLLSRKLLAKFLQQSGKASVRVVVKRNSRSQEEQ